MERMYDEDDEERMTDEQGQRLVEWVINQGLPKEKAYEALAYTMGAAVGQQEEL